MTTTTTPPLTDAARTSVTVTTDGGRVRVRSSVTAIPGQPVLRPVVLGSDQRSARVALVPEGALLLAGDHVAVHLDIGPGVLLEVVEPGGTVAYDMRGGRARWDVSVRVAARGTLLWHGEPFVVAGGAAVTRATELVLEPGARIGLRETLVLGRHQEPAGRLLQRLTATCADGAPLLVEELDLGPTTAAALLGGHRCLGSVLHLGLDVPADEDTLTLEHGGALVRRLGHAAHEVQAEAGWRNVVREARG